MIKGICLLLAENAVGRPASIKHSVMKPGLLAAIGGRTFAIIGALMALLPVCVSAQTPKPPCLGSISICSAGVTPPEGGDVKWNPGHYVQNTRGSDKDSFEERRSKMYDPNASNDDFVGYAVFYRWSQLEGSKGDYSPGIDLIRREVNYLKSLPVPKRLIIQMYEKGWGENCSSTSLFPSYIKNGGLYQTPNNCAWRRWDEATMSDFINLMVALGREFDNEPFIEAVSPFHESSNSFGGSPAPDFSASKLDTQYRRLFNAMADAWPTTSLRFPGNWDLGTSRMQNFHGFLSSLGSAGPGNPDTCPSCGMEADRIYRGSSGGHDYRGELPYFAAIEVSELGWGTVGPSSGFTIREIYDYLDNTQRATHILWDHNDQIGNTSSNPSTGQRFNAMLSLFATDPVRHTACPSSYTSGCATN